jgi:hypothetical protein
MKTYIKQELIDWMKEQPNERPVYMGSGFNDGCGCLMTQFLRSKEVEFSHVGVTGRATISSELVAKIDLGDENILELFERGQRQNFGDLKNLYIEDKN